MILENCPVSKNITALSIMCDKQNTNNCKFVRPTILCGLSISCQLDKSNSKFLVENEENSQNTKQLYLVVYDFMYIKDQEESGNENSNIVSLCNHEDNLNLYPALYEALDINEFETEDVSGYNLMKTLSSYYKTFIPGESDEVFLPPTIATKKDHTGPKVLNDTFDAKKTYTGSKSPLNTSFYISAESISDHIAEVGKGCFFFIYLL